MANIDISTPSVGGKGNEKAGKNRDPTEEFELVEKLGEGSYGTVWKAIHHASGGTTAIKKVPVENDLEEIVNEIKIMKQCKSPYIITYFGSYISENELWIVMEYCGGGSVSDLMKICNQTLDEDQIRCVCRDALKGLSYLHGINKIHRDIKAGNILLNDKGEGKLADFGVSGQLSDTLAKRNTVIGTPFWMAPEVIQEVGYDVRADVWSLGITAIEMAEGKPPYHNIHPMRAIFMIPSRPPPKFTEPDKWSKELCDFLEKCLVKKPSDRPMAEWLIKSHPFIKASSPAENPLVPLIDKANKIIMAHGRSEALGLVETDSEDDDKKDDDEEGGNFSTMVRKPAEENESYGTMVAHETTKIQSSNSQPDFMSHFKKEEPSASAPSPNRPIRPSKGTNTDNKGTLRKNKKFQGLSDKQLRDKLDESLKGMDKEIQEIKEKYAKQKKELEAAIKKKKENLKL